MIKQITLSELRDELAQRKTKKKEFLNRIDRIVPWGEWLKIIERACEKVSVRREKRTSVVK